MKDTVSFKAQGRKDYMGFQWYKCIVGGVEVCKPVHGPPPSLLPTSKSIYKHREQYGEMR
jgi:hypothetical protein